MLPISVTSQNGNFKSINSNTSQVLFYDTLETIFQMGKILPFPKNVEILLPTQYRKKSTGYPKGIKGKEWYEFFKEENSGKWKIGRVDLKISYGRDECVGEDVMIILSINENAILFFTSFDGMSDTILTFAEGKYLFPEHPFSFTFERKEYELIPEGFCLDGNNELISSEVIKSQSIDELIDQTSINKFQLFFRVGGEKPFKIAEIENIESANPKLVWAGDLNRDGLPDVILDLRDFYETQHLFVFLSDKNDLERPLKKLADLRVVNDC